MIIDKLSPTDEEIAVLARTAPDGPVVIINLLKFKDTEDARAQYDRYMAGAAGASHPDIEILHAGPVLADVGMNSDWDYTIIARYRQFADFAGVVTSKIWRAADEHRAKGLERTAMIVTPAEPLGPLHDRVKA